MNNLEQVGLAYRIWEGDNNDHYPMGISVTNGGAMEMVRAGNSVMPFLVMSNELSTARILLCPADEASSFATNFNHLTSSNVSYFVGADVTNDVNPSLILSGDCNFEIGGKPVASGLFSLGTNAPIVWRANRHNKWGNLGFGDGSVQSATQSGLRAYVAATGVATNRWAIP
jgi:prepilin-type processing-associated H-X9-DG protein